MKVEIEIPDEDIKDAIITALEGGSNYWYWIEDLPEKITPVNSEKLVDYAFTNSLNPVVEEEIEVLDIETDDFLGYLNYRNIQRGLQKFIKEGYKFDPAMDADEADLLFQYIVMGEVIYG
jgi:hypothetical protein